MNVKYFNPKTDNPQKYFWFNSFKPDVEIRGDRDRLYKTTGELVPTETARLFKGATDPILSKTLNATVVYVDDENMKAIIDCLSIDSASCTNCLVLDNKNYIFSIQINYGMGIKQIILNAEHYIDVQVHYSLVYYAANIDKYINYEDFKEKFVNPVIEKYVSYYMKKFERLDKKQRGKQ